MKVIEIKTNTVNIATIVKEFERFNYTVSASFNQDKNDDDFMQRYESLMRFLNP